MTHAQTPHAVLQDLLGRQFHLSPTTRLAVRFVAMMVAWEERYRTRKTLFDLSDEMLKDIGLTRDAALSEARRPFWRP